MLITTETYFEPIKERRQSIVEGRRLYPLSNNINHRRGSFTDPALHISHHLPSLSRRSSIVEEEEESIFWRRESLPSISHLTINEYQHPSKSRRGSEQAPYSRSPELRINHKLAERKRRKEMRDLFDDLRDLLPFEKGLRTSKWEILSKGIHII
jgi:hypothetical protein